MNPCDECIVDIMCQKVCDKVLGYTSKIEQRHCKALMLALWMRKVRLNPYIGEVRIVVRLSPHRMYTIIDGSISCIDEDARLVSPMKSPITKGLLFYYRAFTETIVYLGLTPDFHKDEEMTRWRVGALRVYSTVGDKYVQPM